MGTSTQSSLYKLAWPLVISFWLRSLFTFIDTIYAGFLGAAAIAVIGLAISLEFIMIATWGAPGGRSWRIPD